MLSRKALWIITLLFPIILFLAVEGLLRLLRFGPDLSLFVPLEVNGKAYEVMNPAVSMRYFSRVDFRPATSLDVLETPKSPDAFRIFCLGESTTVGFPYWYNAAFPSFLRDYLTRLCPGRKIEVVNLGMTATNSFTVLDEAREVLHYQPDAIVVYDGHNEFYGALGVASRESVGRARWMVEVYLKLLHLKTFVLLRDAYREVVSIFRNSSDRMDRSTMMEKMARGNLIPYGSTLYEDGVQSFRENMRDLTSLCRDAGVPLLLCTQVSNLRDLPPFASLHKVGLGTTERESSDQLVRSGQTLLSERRFDESLERLDEAVAIDPEFALTHYLLACDDDSLGRDSAARIEYTLARDMDPVRFRASSDLNSVIRDLRGRACIADVESLFAANSERGIIGRSLITEHLHPTIYGQFLIARAIIACMKSHGVLLSTEEWRNRDTVPPSELWTERPVTALDERIGNRKKEIVTAGWPFVQEEKVLEDISPSDTLGLIAENVTRGEWTWRQAHEEAAAYYARRKEFFKAAEEMRAIALTYREDAVAYQQWARFALRAGGYAVA
ncbi:MAG TPA: hypothetical protein VMG09_00070, partial [Bacteroidota bacterium]|nr:hypothetical protein [Bacteroidota bacterium]